MRRHRAVLRTSLVLAVVVTALVTGVAASGQILDGPGEPTTTTTAPPAGSSPTTSTTAPAKSGKATQPRGGRWRGRRTDVADEAGHPSGVQRDHQLGEAQPGQQHAEAARLAATADRPRPVAHDAAIVGFGRFPVAGYATFTDDWFNPRFTPVFHLHEGTDLFAVGGTPVRAPVDGVVRHTNGGAGGLAVYVRTKEGHEIYMAHLAGYSDVSPGDQVKVGDVVGFVGDTGNARGGAPHVHFEIHPGGGGRSTRSRISSRGWRGDHSCPDVGGGYEAVAPRRRRHRLDPAPR